MGRHFAVTASTGWIAWQRQRDRIDEEARPDGLHVIRTSPDATAIGTDNAVWAYRNLARVERAFRHARSDLKVRPIHVHSADHVRGHVFPCMLALYIEWHMSRRLAPILSGDDDWEGARARRSSPVKPANVSGGAKARADTKRTLDGMPVHSFATLHGPRHPHPQHCHAAQ